MHFLLLMQERGGRFDRERAAGSAAADPNAVVKAVGPTNTALTQLPKSLPRP